METTFIGPKIRSISATLIRLGSLRFSFPVVLFALSLFCMDVTLLTVHVLGVLIREGLFGTPSPNVLLDWRIDEDSAWPEFYEYTKTILIAAFALACMKFRGAKTYGPIVFTAFILLFDNSFQIHESSKSIIIPIFGLSHGSAELAYIIMVGLVLLGFLLYGVTKAADDDRVVLWSFIAIFAVLGGFGGGVDFLHNQIGWRSSSLDYILAFIEDGGELVTLSLGCILLAAAYAERVSENFRS